MTTREIELELQNRELLQAQHQLAQSKLRYADLFDFAPIGYVTLDSDCKIVEVNLAGARLLGGTPNHFIGQAFEQFITAADRPQFRRHMERCRKSAHKSHTELRLAPVTGGAVSVELYTVAAREMEQGALQCRCAILNLTERKSAEEALRRSQAELELRANHHFLSEASAVFSASLDYETALSNVVRTSIPRLADCCVVDMVQPSGAVARSAVAHLDHAKEELLWQLGKIAEDRNEVFGKIKVIRTARSELYANVSDSLLTALARSPVHLATLRELGFRSFMCVPLVVRGKAIGAVGFMRVQPDQHYTLSDLALAEEFTDRAAVAVDNAMLYTKEQEANRLKDDFLAIVSHELRTPLTPILGAMYQLRLRRSDDEDIRKAAEMVERNAKRQSRVIDELLDVSRLATGKFELNRRLSDVAGVVVAAVAVARPAAEIAGISIETSIDSAIRRIYCDPDRIQQALWNLLSNAIKFSLPGGRILVRVESTPSAIRIAIRDEGEGIAEDFLPHVFETFRQAGSFTARRHGGLGLGLSVVKHIFQQHGGTVRATSDGAGQGATFIAELPYPRSRELRIDKKDSGKVSE